MINIADISCEYELFTSKEETIVNSNFYATTPFHVHHMITIADISCEYELFISKEETIVNSNFYATTPFQK